MKIPKEVYPEIVANKYFINFDSDFRNYYFVNFELDELRTFIKREGILKLYNDWLDFIGNSCYVCENKREAERSCVIAKVISVGEDDIEIEKISFASLELEK